MGLIYIVSKELNHSDPRLNTSIGVTARRRVIE